MEERKRIHKWLIVLVAVVVLVCVGVGVVGTIRAMTQPVNDRTCFMGEAWAIAFAADAMGDEETKDILRKRIKRIKYIELTDFLSGVVPYIGIGNALSLPMDEEKVLACLRQWYVPEQKMFTYLADWIQNGRTDQISCLNATMMLLGEYPQVLGREEEFHLREGILAGVQSFTYALPDGSQSQYMSGGICVRLIGVLSDFDGTDYTWALPENIQDWYEAWEAYLTEQNTTPDKTRWEVRRVLQQATSYAEAQTWFNALDAASASTLDINFLITLRTLWPMIDVTQNLAFYDALRVRVRELAQDFQFGIYD